MKAAPFDYVRATTVAEAVAALHAAGENGKILAGGQSLIPMMALRLARPTVLVDIARIPGLDRIEPAPNMPTGTTEPTLRDGMAAGTVRFGAMVRHRALERQRDHALVAEAAAWIGHSAIRSRGTLAGSLAHADASAELPLVAVALAAVVEASGPNGTHRIAIDQFFDGPFQTRLGFHDVVTAVEMAQPSRWGFAELARRHGDFALIAVVAAQVAGRWRVVVGGVSGMPYRALSAEAVLDSQPLDAATVAAAAHAATVGLDTFTDIHATARYRLAMVRQLTATALRAAQQQPGGAAR